MKNQITIFLSILLFIPLMLLADDMSVESFKRLDIDMDARINYPEKDPSGRTCAIIKIVNPNTGFVFDTGTVSVVKTRQEIGEIWVYVQPGVKKLTIKHPSLGVMRDYYFPMAIDEATVYELRLTTGTVHTYVEQKSSSAFLVVNSVPEGADIFVDGEWVGNTPFNKKYNIGQTLQYRISSPLYHDEVGEVKLDKTKTEIITELKKAFGSIIVTSEPDGATVLLDNDTEPRGTTPLTIDKVASGAHRVRVKKPKYGQQMIDVTVTDGGSVTADALLNASFANVTVNTLPGATIKVDGSVKGTSSATWEQDAGVCDIEVSLDGHRKQSRQIQVTPGEPQTITLEPIPMYGILVVESDPAGADIYIDGLKCGETPEVLEHVLASNHIVKLTKPGFKDYMAEVTIGENEELGVNVKLLTNVTTYENEIEVHPSEHPSIPFTFDNSVEYTVKGVKFYMVPVEGGTFTMGATGKLAKDAESYETPIHDVTLSDYMIGQTEVTQALWKAVMGKNPSYHVEDNLPVNKVSWKDCQDFIKKLNKLTGLNFRLPTEAEWEYAAKGGKKANGYLYSGSDDIDSVSWYSKNSSYDKHPVATKAPNELGIYDMTGNVWEWCSDWKSSYSSTPQTNPIGPASGSTRVFRGGSYGYDPQYCRSSSRNYDSSDRRNCDLGFRLALVP